jgi:putative flippase GtrA
VLESLMQLFERLGLSKRFIQFGLVGVSGVFVNLLCLKVFLSLGIVSSIASALSIQVSILSNFLLHDHWTFKDHVHHSLWLRILKFQMISMLGALIQWSVFLIANVCWLWLGLGIEDWASYMLDYSLMKLILNPPQVGIYMYASQLLGIMIATAWNFLANLKFTWTKHH